MKKIFNYIYDKYGNYILWILLVIQALAVSISSYK